jgi:hypothetical protein
MWDANYSQTGFVWHNFELVFLHPFCILHDSVQNCSVGFFCQAKSQYTTIWWRGKEWKNEQVHALVISLGEKWQRTCTCMQEISCSHWQRLHASLGNKKVWSLHWKKKMASLKTPLASHCLKFQCCNFYNQHGPHFVPCPKLYTCNL